MMRFNLILLAFISWMAGAPTALKAQSSRHLSLELAGSGGLGSLNFEQQFWQHGALDLHFRAGFSLAPVDRNNGTALVFPLMVHATYGKASHKAEFGLGQSISITTKKSFFFLAPLSIGYRYAPSDARYYLRLAYTPIVSYLLDRQWQHWAGFTFGYQLNTGP